MFEVLSRVHAGDRVPVDREECMEWAKRQLELCGVRVISRGLCFAYLKPDIEGRLVCYRECKL